MSEQLRLPTLRFYRDDLGDWRWSLMAHNGNPISACTEGYRRLADCIQAWDITRGPIKGMVEVTKDGEQLPFDPHRT